MLKYTQQDGVTHRAVSGRSSASTACEAAVVASQSSIATGRIADSDAVSVIALKLTTTTCRTALPRNL